MKIKNLLKNLALLFVSIFLAIFIFEIYLRLTGTNYCKGYYRHIILREQTPNDNRKYLRDRMILKEGGYVTIQTDEDGFLLPDFIKRDGDRVVTIAFLGGSSTECFWVRDTLRFPYLVGEKAATTFNTSIRILNSGGAGNNTHHCLNVLLNKIINYKPNIVIMMEAVNDAAFLMSTGNYKAAMIKEVDYSIADLLSRKIYFIGFLRHLRAQYLVNRQRREIAFRQIGEKNKKSYDVDIKDIDKLNKSLEQFSTRLKIFVDVVRDMNAIPVLMTQPYYKRIDYELNKEGKRTFLAGIDYMDEFNNEIRKVANVKKCVLIDLEKELGKDEIYFYDWLHYSEEGSKRVAEIIFKHLKDIVSSAVVK